MTTITLPPEIEAPLVEQARQMGTSPEELAISLLRERFAPHDPVVPVAPGLKMLPFEPRDDFERWLLSVGKPCGGLVTDEALRRENLYDDRS